MNPYSVFLIRDLFYFFLDTFLIDEVFQSVAFFLSLYIFCKALVFFQFPACHLIFVCLFLFISS